MSSRLEGGGRRGEGGSELAAWRKAWWWLGGGLGGPANFLQRGANTMVCSIAQNQLFGGMDGWLGGWVGRF